MQSIKSEGERKSKTSLALQSDRMKRIARLTLCIMSGIDAKTLAAIEKRKDIKPAINSKQKYYSREDVNKIVEGETLRANHTCKARPLTNTFLVQDYLSKPMLKPEPELRLAYGFGYENRNCRS